MHHFAWKLFYFSLKPVATRIMIHQMAKFHMQLIHLEVTPVKYKTCFQEKKPFLSLRHVAPTRQIFWAHRQARLPSQTTSLWSQATSQGITRLWNVRACWPVAVNLILDPAFQIVTIFLKMWMMLSSSVHLILSFKKISGTLPVKLVFLPYRKPFIFKIRRLFILYSNSAVMWMFCCFLLLLMASPYRIGHYYHSQDTDCLLHLAVFGKHTLWNCYIIPNAEVTWCIWGIDFQLLFVHRPMFNFVYLDTSIDST